MKFFTKNVRYKKLIQAFGIIAITATSAYADETMSFKGIKFGMNAEEIAKLGGGDTKHGCFSAIKNSRAVFLDGGTSWTYGGIDAWTASCVEEWSKEEKVPGTSGLYKIHALAWKHGTSYISNKEYSVEELVEIFSKVFGKFQIENQIVKNGFGQEFDKKRAVATASGAVIEIMDVLHGKDHDKFIQIEITSLDYLTKKMNWENQKSSRKLSDSKSDF
jgi:hypothetical protein